MNLTYLGYGLLIGPAILVVVGIVWCYLVINSDINKESNNQFVGFFI